MAAHRRHPTLEERLDALEAGGASSSVGDYWYGQVSAGNLAAPVGGLSYHPDEVYEESGSSLDVVDDMLTVLEAGVYAVTALVVMPEDYEHEAKVSFSTGFSNTVTPVLARDFAGYAGNNWEFPALQGVGEYGVGYQPAVNVNRIGAPTDFNAAYIEFSMYRLA